jgi:ribonuclease-3
VSSALLSSSDIERLVGRSVNDPALFEQALTHRSRFRGRADTHLATNERLEFLGDALLGFVMAEVLYERFPDKNEGYLTRLRAKLVSRKALARYARRIDLGPHLLMSDNAEQSEGRDNPNILSDAYEALIGALYLDQGMAAAQQFIHASALDPIDLTAVAAQNENYKSQLLEYAQARGRAQPTYRVAHAEGPSHDRTFTVEALLDGTAYGKGTAGSKKKAEQLAAAEALNALREKNSAKPTD